MNRHTSCLIAAVLLAASASLAAQQPPMPNDDPHTRSLMDLHRTFRQSVGDLQNHPKKTPEQQKPIRERCVAAVQQYNTKAAASHRGLFKRHSLPESVSAGECI